MWQATPPETETGVGRPSDRVLGTVHVGVEHHIRLKEDTAPIAHRPGRLSPEEEAEVRKETNDLIWKWVL